MATFELIEDGTYKVEGEITQEDIEKINSFKIRTNLVLQNTKGQSSETIRKINNDNVYFSILGGLDYYNKSKFNNQEYIERTQCAPKGLTKILQYFEKIEAEMNPQWTDTQKCMYAYNALAVDINYVRDLKQNILTSGVTERGLNGILYNQLTCAGMAQTFKEMMDRLGIPCHYQNQRHVHAFNVVKLDGKLRGIDVTWDCTKSDEEKCSFRNFGKDSQFYEKYGHRIAEDNQETLFDLTTFTDEEIEENYSVIESAINERKRIVYPFKDFDRERKRKYLPVNRFMENLDDEKTAIFKLRLLKQFGNIPEEIEEFVNSTGSRYGFINDYLGNNNGDTDIVHKLSEINNKTNFDGFLMMEYGKVLLVTSENGERKESELTPEQQQELSPVLFEDVKQYYTQFFKTEAPQIDELIETYEMIKNMPPEMKQKTETLKADLYTKIVLFAKGKKFFEQFEISKEDIEIVTEKAAKYIEGIRDVYVEPKEKHENDLDFLYALVKNDIIDTMATGRDYTEQDLARLMTEVRTNWEDAEFLDEEFKTLLDEALGKTMNSEDISRGTVDSGIGIDEITSVTNEIKRTQTKDLQKAQER